MEYSKGGLISAGAVGVFAVIAMFGASRYSAVAGFNSLIFFLCGAIVLLIRSFRPPLHWAQGGLSTIGGMFLGMGIADFLGFGISTSPLASLIASLLWSCPFFYAGFKKPKQKLEQKKEVFLALFAWLLIFAGLVLGLLILGGILDKNTKFIILGISGWIMFGFGLWLRRYKEKLRKAHGEEIKKDDITIETKKCPKCAEEVQFEALVCRYCKHEFREAEILKEKQKKADYQSFTGIYEEEIKKEKISAGSKKCPSCAENIKLEALLCRYCGHQFDEADIAKIKVSSKIQATIKKWERKTKKLNRSINLRRTSGITLILIGSIVFLLIIIPQIAKGEIPGILLSIGFSSLIVLPGLILLKSSMKRKLALSKLREELHELMEIDIIQ